MVICGGGWIINLMRMIWNICYVIFLHRDYLVYSVFVIICVLYLSKNLSRELCELFYKLKEILLQKESILNNNVIIIIIIIGFVLTLLLLEKRKLFVYTIM